MKYHIECPSCNKKIIWLALMFKVSPFIFTCNHCNKFLKAKNIFWWIFFATTILGLFFPIYIYHAFYDNQGTYIDALILISYIFVIIYFHALIVCNKANIETLKKD